VASPYLTPKCQGSLPRQASLLTGQTGFCFWSSGLPQRPDFRFNSMRTQAPHLGAAPGVLTRLAAHWERAKLAEIWLDHGMVFPSELGTPMEPRNLNRHFAQLRAAAGLPDVRLHDLRHTVVSLLMERGVAPHIVQAIARHADVKITLKIYAHTNLDQMRSAFGKLDGTLE
jgi:integrase